VGTARGSSALVPNGIRLVIAPARKSHRQGCLTQRNSPAELPMIRDNFRCSDSMVANVAKFNV
jgi:hypothetical protein